jgi:hypothetical protein
MPTLDQVLDAIEKVESGGNTYARSPAGAMGAYQFMPATAKEYGLTNPYDRRASRAAAERKMQDLLHEYDNDLTKAVAAYNLGQGNLRKVGGDWTRVPETNQYVQKVAAASMAKQKPVQDDEWEDVTHEYVGKASAPADDEWEDVTEQYRAKLAEPTAPVAAEQPKEQDFKSWLGQFEQDYDPAKMGKINKEFLEMAAGQGAVGAIPVALSKLGKAAAGTFAGAAMGAAPKEGLGEKAKGAAIGGSLGGIGEILAPAASTVGIWGKRAVSKNAAAVGQLDKELAGKFTPSVMDSPLDAPAPWSYTALPGVKQTAGMLSNDQRILKLEQGARVRNVDGKFSERDIGNTKEVFDLLERKALSQQEREALRQKLNNDTGPLREAAFEKARQNGGPFQQANGMQVGKVKPPVSIDVEKDDLMTAIRKLGGINKESAQNIYGNELWKDVQFAGHPAHGPVWRNGEAGQPLDEIAKRLHENGYLDQPDYGEMLDTLYEVSKGTADASRVWSKNKQQFSGIYGSEINSERDDLISSMQSLVDELRVKNAPKIKAEKPVTELPLYASPLIKEVERLGSEAGVRGTKGADQLSKMANKRLGYDDLQPEDLYSLRKEIDDSLSASGINLDDATNAIKSGRREAVQVKKAIDQGLNETSDGAWDKYLQAYRQGKAPIREGQAFDDIIGSTKNNYRLPIEGSESRNITRAGLRRAAEKYTYDKRGRQGLVDILSPGNRADLGDSIRVLEDMERARTGALAINGSRTSSDAANLTQQGIGYLLGPKGKAAIDYITSMGASRGLRELDDALLNPDSGKLQTLLDLYQKSKRPPTFAASARKAASLGAYGAGQWGK